MNGIEEYRDVPIARVIRREGAMYCVDCDTIYDFREIKSPICPTCSNRHCVPFRISVPLEEKKAGGMVSAGETRGGVTGPALSDPKPPAQNMGMEENCLQLK